MKSAPKKRGRKKSIFAGHPEISKRKLELDRLKSNRDKLLELMRNNFKKYNSKAITEQEAERWIERLPLETLRELCDFLSGKEITFNMEKLNIRSRLRVNQDKDVDTLHALESEIAMKEIDLLLEKVNILLGK